MMNDAASASAPEVPAESEPMVGTLALPGHRASYGASPGILPRLMSGLALASTALMVAWAGIAGYQYLTDSIVAPVDVSLANTSAGPTALSAARLSAEREQLAHVIQQNQEALDVISKSIEGLRSLQASLQKEVERLSSLGRSGESDQRLLAQQASILRKNIAAQQAYVLELSDSEEHGLARKSDVLHELAELNRMKLAYLDLRRSRLQSVEKRGTDGAGAAESSPELAQKQEQIVRNDIELTKLESERRVKEKELEAAKGRLPQLAELDAELQKQPLIRATRSGSTAAFAPYAQIEGLKRGASVYHCRMWGLFLCDAVGKVTEILPGEVTNSDAFGGNTRGQYVLLQLTNPEAIRARTLRARSAN